MITLQKFPRKSREISDLAARATARRLEYESAIVGAILADAPKMLPVATAAALGLDDLSEPVFRLAYLAAKDRPDDAICWARRAMEYDGHALPDESLIDLATSFPPIPQFLSYAVGRLRSVRGLIDRAKRHDARARAILAEVADFIEPIECLRGGLR